MATRKAGPKGRRGPTGKRGARGLKGKRGAPGLKGARGLRGKRGETGLQGQRGPVGHAGRRGPKGLRGPHNDWQRQVLRVVEERFADVNHQLDIQLKRIAQLQAEIDLLKRALKS